MTEQWLVRKKDHSMSPFYNNSRPIALIIVTQMKRQLV